MPADFARIHGDTVTDAVTKGRADEEATGKTGVAEAGELDLGPGLGNVRFGIAAPGYVLGPADRVFDVPFDVAAAITGLHHTRGESWELLTDLRALEPVKGNVLARLSHPRKWWQTLNSVEYR